MSVHTRVTVVVESVRSGVREATDLIAATQLGLITHAQAKSAGLTDAAIRHRIRRTLWIRVRTGVYRQAAVPTSWRQAVLAATLGAGPHAWASHASAAILWGFARFPETPIEITVPLDKRPRLAPVRVHRSGTITDADVRVADGIPALSPARTIADLSSRLDDSALGAMVDDGLRRRVLTLSSLHAVAQRLPTIAPGRSPKRVERVLAIRIAGYHPGDSELETRVLRIIVDAGLPEPVRQHRVVVGERVYLIDLAYPNLRVAIEVDGFDFHHARAAFDADRRRQNDLVNAGWTVLRFTSESSPDEIIASVRRALLGR